MEKSENNKNEEKINFFKKHNQILKDLGLASLAISLIIASFIGSSFVKDNEEEDKDE